MSLLNKDFSNNPQVVAFTNYLFNSMNPTQREKFINKYENPITSGLTGKQLGGAAMGALASHPYKTAGLVGLGAGNLGGLFDNNKFGGQLGGLALGGLGSYALGLNPYATAMLTMGGGELGSLFDKLRAQKEQPQQYYGGN